MSININHLVGDVLSRSVEMVANHIKSGYNLKHEGESLRLVEPSTTEKIAKWIPFINHDSMIPEKEVIENLRVALLRANQEGLSETKKEKLEIIRSFCDRVIAAKGMDESYEAEEAPIETLQKDVLVNIVAPHLKASDLTSLSQASKTMHAKASGIARAKRRAEADFGPEQWAEMGVKIDDVPPIPKVIVNREDPDSYLVVLIPGGISFNQLVDKSGVGYAFKWGPLDEYGNKPEDKSYWVAIKKELMLGSLETVTRQEQLDMAKDGTHQAPSLMEAVACNIASYKSTGKSLWGEKSKGLPWYSTCREEKLDDEVLEDAERFVVGGSAAGLNVDYNYDYDCVGVARLLREVLAP